MSCGFAFEQAAIEQGATLIAGVDEAGRGPLFGPVVAAACILLPDTPIEGVRDSKLVGAVARKRLAEEIRQRAVAWAVAEVSAARIDQINIRQATREAMRMAVDGLAIKPDWLLIDGNCAIEWPGRQQTIVSGDAQSMSIAAASILAKVHRDNLLLQYDAEYPEYLLARNKGYPTADHLKALAEHGPSPLHRRSFAPVRAVMKTGNLFE